MSKFIEVLWGETTILLNEENIVSIQKNGEELVFVKMINGDTLNINVSYEKLIKVLSRSSLIAGGVRVRSTSLQ